MLTYLILLFTIVPAVELIVIIKVGSAIGALNTILLIILTGVTGAFLARMQGLLVLYRIQSNLDRGTMPTSEMLDGVLIPITRTLLKAWFQKKLQSMMSQGRIITITPTRRNDDSFDL